MLASSESSSVQIRLWVRGARIIPTVLLIVALAACGGSGSGPTPPCTSCPPASSSDYVYEANAGQVTIYEVDSTTGTVVSTPSPATGPMLPAGMIATSTDFIYLADFGGNDDAVYGYSVNTQTGALTAITGSPFTTGLTAPPEGLASDPLGKFLYVTQGNNNQIAGFTIGSNGALSPMAGSPFNTGDTYPSAIAVDAAGAFLYASNNQSPLGRVSGFSIAPTTGALTPVTGSPFTTAVNGGPTNLAVSPKASFLYVPLAGISTPLSSIFAYTFDSTGVLSQIPGTPFMVGSQPNTVIVDPSGKYLYSADFGGNDISAFTIDSSSGALTAISGSPFAASPNPDYLAINASSSLLFATSGTSTSIFAFTIDSSGALTAVAPLNGGGTPGGLAIIHKE